MFDEAACQIVRLAQVLAVREALTAPRERRAGEDEPTGAAREAVEAARGAVEAARARLAALGARADRLAGAENAAAIQELRRRARDILAGAYTGEYGGARGEGGRGDGVGRVVGRLPDGAEVTAGDVVMASAALRACPPVASQLPPFRLGAFGSTGGGDWPGAEPGAPIRAFLALMAESVPRPGSDRAPPGPFLVQIGGQFVAAAQISARGVPGIAWLDVEAGEMTVRTLPDGPPPRDALTEAARRGIPDSTVRALWTVRRWRDEDGRALPARVGPDGGLLVALGPTPPGASPATEFRADPWLLQM